MPAQHATSALRLGCPLLRLTRESFIHPPDSCPNVYTIIQAHCHVFFCIIFGPVKPKKPISNHANRRKTVESTKNWAKSQNLKELSRASSHRSFISTIISPDYQTVHKKMTAQTPTCSPANPPKALTTNGTTTRSSPLT